MDALASHEEFQDRLNRIRRENHDILADPDGRFDRHELNELCALWRAKAADGIPQRCDFSLRDLAPILRHVSIMERCETGRYRYRFHGSKLAELMGDRTNTYVDEAVPEDTYLLWKENFDAVLEGGAPVRIVSTQGSPRFDFVVGESFVAPLAAPDGTPVMLLAATYTKSKAGDVAR